MSWINGAQRCASLTTVVSEVVRRLNYKAGSPICNETFRVLGDKNGNCDRRLSLTLEAAIERAKKPPNASFILAIWSSVDKKGLPDSLPQSYGPANNGKSKHRHPQKGADRIFMDNTFLAMPACPISRGLEGFRYSNPFGWMSCCAYCRFSIHLQQTLR